MLVYRMTPVPLRLFRKNLGNLQVFPVGQVVRSFPSSPPPPSPPAGNKWPLPAPMIALVSLTRY